MGGRAAVIAAEQRAVDHAYVCYEQKLAKNRGLKKKTWDVTDSEAGTDFIPDTPPEIRYVDDLGGQALVFQRVDVAEDDDDTPRTYYVGRRLVRDPAGDIIVVAWQAPIVTEWRLARLDAPGDVRLRRTLSCDGRLVKDYSDELRIDLPQRDAARAVQETYDPAQERQRMSDFLLDDLERARDGKMRDIVETIRQEQLQLVSDQRKGLLVVQGGPGTGKTAVGLHRVSWLLYNGVFEPRRVLVVGPHRGFLDYISQVLPSLDIHEAPRVELDLLWAYQSRRNSRPQATDTAQAAAVKSDGRMAEVLSRAVDNLVPVDVLTRLKGGRLRISFEGVELTVTAEEIRSFVESDVRGIPYKARRKRSSDALVDRLMHAFAGVRPRQTLDSGLRGRISRHPGVASLMHSMWPQMTAESVLRSLLGNPDTLRAAASGILDVEEQRAIYRPANVILSPSGPRVVDLGIARAVDETRVTRTGLLIGSPAWMSPEHYQDGDVGPATDVHAWGLLVAFAATGRRPFGSGRPEVLAVRIMQQNVDLTGLDPDLRGIVSRRTRQETGGPAHSTRTTRLCHCGMAPPDGCGRR